MGAPRALGILALAGAAAAALAWRRRNSGPREHVDVYFADGSMISFEPGSTEGEQLLPLARRALAAARG
jgi:hypothetical protein